jgi:hypothetical protein
MAVATNNAVAVPLLMLRRDRGTLPGMMAVVRSLLLTVRDSARSRAILQLELLALRHQVLVLQRTRPRRVPLTTPDRWLWIWLSRLWTEWRRSLGIVEPATVLHGTAAACGCTRPGRAAAAGRPPVPMEVRKLIRTMSRMSFAKTQ